MGQAEDLQHKRNKKIKKIKISETHKRDFHHKVVKALFILFIYYVEFSWQYCAKSYV